MAYTFNLLRGGLGAEGVRALVHEVQALQARIGDGWPCWSLGNHDSPRVMSRLGGAHPPPALAPLLLALLTSLRGSACIYQGEELGLPEAELPFEALRDPYGIAFWPAYKGRDGCRTPMPWDADLPHAGFSTATPWLPVDAAHPPLAVRQQQADGGSVLHAVRRFLAWRRGQPALVRGSLVFLDAPAPCLLLQRQWQGQSVLAAFNLSAAPQRLDGAALGAVTPLEGHGLGGHRDGGGIVLPAWSAWFGQQA